MHFISEDWSPSGYINISSRRCLIRVVSEEHLLNFAEVHARHDGINLAHIVMETIRYYGLETKVIAVTSDNASNNNTMMVELQRLMWKEGAFGFRATDARMRCLAHTIHLAAMKVCSSHFSTLHCCKWPFIAAFECLGRLPTCSFRKHIWLPREIVLIVRRRGSIARRGPCPERALI